MIWVGVKKDLGGAFLTSTNPDNVDSAASLGDSEVSTIENSVSEPIPAKALIKVAKSLPPLLDRTPTTFSQTNPCGLLRSRISANAMASLPLASSNPFRVAVDAETLARRARYDYIHFRPVSFDRNVTKVGDIGVVPS